ncbi:HAD family hydrolase [Olivibacter sp. SDN3]|uniref:HAD family hydrolase n=1 Tax=Olivibacter sp. SDN3 TaxID=2764720 RepID=UPI001650D923|nr:HAD family hydrolase [Olivibacter sp. SDN3]QNL48290.1 HAD family hydrolase [Olivibacter sp. SDN3]
MVKGVLIDYGGTIDTNGRHWANVIWEAYKNTKLDVEKEQFLLAYAHGERSLAIQPIIKPFHTFDDVLRLKIAKQFDFLKLDEQYQDKIDEIASICMELVLKTINHAKPILEVLAERYPLVLVSNFYGNIHAVLNDLNIIHYFSDIVESAVVGVRKPNPEIYQLGVERIGLLAQDCVVVGDSFKKDIVPGKAIGCQTIWINVEGIEEDFNEAETTAADIQITDFDQIPAALIAL